MSPELKDFLTGIATDPDRLTRYTTDPEAEMAAANLPEADREILRKTDPAGLSDLLPVVTMKNNNNNVPPVPPRPDQS